jgi:hypothetical protein
MTGREIGFGPAISISSSSCAKPWRHRREVLAKLQATPTDKELVKTVTALGNLTIALSTKLRLTVQADVVRQSRKIDQREPKANVLLGGWERPA